MKKSKAKHLVGCCGLYCGLCSKYQSQAPSRCKGCRLGEQHAWCSIWNCCVKKHGFETCTECGEIWNCAIFRRRKVIEWIPVADNCRRIEEAGLENWLKEQMERQMILEELLQHYNEGRSMTFYCKVCARIPIDLIRRTVKEAKKNITSEKIDPSDVKSKAKILKSTFKDLALIAGVDLS